MKDSLTITAQAIPFLMISKILLNFTYLLKLFIMYRKDNTLSAILQKKKRTHFPANPFTEYNEKN